MARAGGGERHAGRGWGEMRGSQDVQIEGCEQGRASLPFHSLPVLPCGPARCHLVLGDRTPLCNATTIGMKSLPARV